MNKENIDRRQLKKFFRNKPGWFIRGFYKLYLIVLFIPLFPIPVIFSIFTNESIMSMYEDAYKAYHRFSNANFV